MTTRELSPAYDLLRTSTRRVDQLIQHEIARQEDGTAIIYTDQLDSIGSRRRVWRPAMAELHALGLYDVARFPKRYICKASERWRAMTPQDARIASTMAREHAGDTIKPRRNGRGAASTDSHAGKL